MYFTIVKFTKLVSQTATLPYHHHHHHQLIPIKLLISYIHSIIQTVKVYFILYFPKERNILKEQKVTDWRKESRTMFRCVGFITQQRVRSKLHKNIISFGRCAAYALLKSTEALNPRLALLLNCNSKTIFPYQIIKMIIWRVPTVFLQPLSQKDNAFSASSCFSYQHAIYVPLHLRRNRRSKKVIKVWNVYKHIQQNPWYSPSAISTGSYFNYISCLSIKKEITLSFMI